MVSASTFGESKFKGTFLHFVSCHTHTAPDFWNLVIAFKSPGSNAGTPQVCSQPQHQASMGWVKPLSPGSLEQWVTGLTAMLILKAKSRGSTKKWSHFPLKTNCFPSYEIWILPLERFFSIPQSREGPLFYNPHLRICFSFPKIDKRKKETETEREREISCFPQVSQQEIKPTA